MNSAELIAALSQRLARQLCPEGEREWFALVVTAELQEFAEGLDAAQELYKHTDILTDPCCLAAREDFAKKLAALAKLRALGEER